MNLIGKKIEEFKVPALVGEEFKQVTEKDLDGVWSVLFFYPGDFTFVCPTELEDLQNLYEDFRREHTNIYSVSTDSEFVHKAWKDRSDRIKKVEFSMISDRNFVLSKMLDVLIPEEGQALRASFIINPNREVVAYEINAPGVGRNAHELLRKVRASQFVHKHGDKVCPANWEPGDEVLTPGIDLVGEL